MKNQRVFIILALLSAVFVAVWFNYRPKGETRTDTQPVAVAALSSNSQAHVAASNSSTNQPVAVIVDDSKNSSIPADILAKYRQGLITKDEAIVEVQKRQFVQPQNFYGKVIDQNGDPVSGVGITAGNETLTDNVVQPQTFTVRSDSDGLFEITGKTGTSIGVRLIKNGYLWGLRGEGYKAPASGVSSPADRVVLTMWKLHGPELLTSYNIDSKIPHDGNPVIFEMATGKASPSGDFRVTLSQFPLDVRTGRERFDWTAKVEILNGGLVEENDPYPYMAPANGYQPSFEFNVSSNSPEWLPNLKKNFYTKNAQGQYGIMQFAIYPGRSPTGLEAHFTINPSGSQNLEPSIDK